MDKNRRQGREVSTLPFENTVPMSFIQQQTDLPSFTHRNLHYKRTWIEYLLLLSTNVEHIPLFSSPMRVFCDKVWTVIILDSRDLLKFASNELEIKPKVNIMKSWRWIVNYKLEMTATHWELLPGQFFCSRMPLQLHHHHHHRCGGSKFLPLLREPGSKIEV